MSISSISIIGASRRTGWAPNFSAWTPERHSTSHTAASPIRQCCEAACGLLRDPSEPMIPTPSFLAIWLAPARLQAGRSFYPRAGVDGTFAARTPVSCQTGRPCQCGELGYRRTPTPHRGPPWTSPRDRSPGSYRDQGGSTAGPAGVIAGIIAEIVPWDRWDHQRVDSTLGGGQPAAYAPWLLQDMLGIAEGPGDVREGLGVQRRRRHQCRPCRVHGRHGLSRPRADHQQDQ